MPLRRVIPASSAAMLVALAAGGCVGRSAVSATGSGRDYIAGSGTVRHYAPAARKPAPHIRGTTLTGTALDLGGYRGDVIVLNFWASWCPPCRDEADGLAQAYVDSKARGVRFVGVNFKDDASNARIFTATRKTPYPSLLDRYGDLMVRFSASVPPSAIPTTLVIDRSGRIAASVYGPVTYTAIMALVTSTASERAA